jgi:hypothetical protein
MLTKNAGL